MNPHEGPPMGEPGDAERQKTPDWKEILKQEGVPYFIYVLPKDPLTIGKMVEAAVLQTLTNTDQIGANSADALVGAPGVAGLVDRHLLGNEINNFPVERMEAARQGLIAQGSDLNRWQPFRVSYDYWEGSGIPVKVGEHVEIDRPREGDDFLLMQADSDHIEGQAGFPKTLARRRTERKLRSYDFLLNGYTEEKPEQAQAAFDELVSKMVALGSDRQAIIESIEGCAVMNMFDENVDYEKMNKILTDNGAPSLRYEDFDEFWPRRLELMKLIYDNLSPEEQEKVTRMQDPRNGVFGYVYRDFAEGDQKAKLTASAYFGGAKAGYNPETGRTKVDISGVNEISLEVRVEPVITPQTTQEQLLAIRQQAVELLGKAQI